MNSENQTFEASMARLEQIVRAMERGDVALEESLKLFQEGTELVRSCQKLLDLLPPELQDEYRPLLFESDPDVAKIVKAADKLSAYIKCVEELKAGNSEFEAAETQTRQALVQMQLPCLDYFMAHFLDSFRLTLDELE